MKYSPRAYASEVNDPPPRTVHRTALSLLGAFLVVVLAGYGLVGVAAEWAISRVSVETEVELFRTLTDNGWAPFPVVKGDDPRRERADRLMREMAASSMSDAWKLSLDLVSDPEPNAYALPGGRVLVTTGLLELLPKGSEGDRALAFVLGHELGHIFHRHPLRRMGRSLLLSLAVRALLGTEGLGWVASTGRQLESLAYTRGQERAADEFAIDVMLQTYGSLEHAETFFEAVLQDAGSAAPEFLSTHPDVRGRLKRLEERKRGLRPPSEPAVD